MVYSTMPQMKDKITLRKIKSSDCEDIHMAFHEQGWDKPASLYQTYCTYQESKVRDIIIAEYQNIFAGYLTIQWTSHYLPFKEKGIPEIVDFNVLMKFQRLGIGTCLMNEAENRIKKISDFAGLGFGIISDYGAAQILYIKRGYIPDGKGLVKDFQSVGFGDIITVDHSLALYHIKKL